MNNFTLFASCPKGLEYILQDELKALGLHVTQVNPQGVYGDASLTTLYQLCLWSRIANRIQLILFSGQAHNEQTIHTLCQQFPWQTVFTPDKSMAISFHGTSPSIRNAMYGAQVVKDAIVDYFRNRQNQRPSVERQQPQILLHAHLKQETLTVSFDLVGYSLHQRGYRQKGGLAPLKENLAAALLVRANWPNLAQEGYAFHDPFCGSGTIVIEAAMMAANIAPGLLRTDQSLRDWVAHQPSLWEKIRGHALKTIRPTPCQISGSDVSKKAIQLALENAKNAKVSRLVNFEVNDITNCSAAHKKGLIVCNPPYGERLAQATELMPLYQQMGHVLHDQYQSWQAAFLTSNPMLAKATGLRSHKQYTVYNGPLACQLYCLELTNNRLKNRTGDKRSDGAQMFANRLQKNIDHLKKWAKREQIHCYRVYDADLPEYAYAIDLYEDHAVLQEYAPPKNIPATKAEQRSLDVIQVTPEVLGIPAQNLVIKQRQRQRGPSQYQKLGQSNQNLIVSEGRAKLIVNLYDYLDTGLFLDHRPLRMTFSQLQPNTQFLNCFCYTASASVHAALSGAKTTNIDLSKTYLRWAEENFKLNGLNPSEHQFIHENCLKWLQTSREQFNTIFLDPPSFSNSKRMDTTFDIQRDHVPLILAAMKRLTKEGVLYFSTNLRKFKLSPIIISHYLIEDISEETIDIDFKRHKRIHQCFKLKHKN